MASTSGLDPAYLNPPRVKDVLDFHAGMAVPGELPDPVGDEKYKLPPPPTLEQPGVNPC